VRDGSEEPRIGPTPAPGTGRPATNARLGRVGVIIIVVVALLYLTSWIAWAVFGPDVDVKIQYHHHERDRDQREPHGPGRLTLAPPYSETEHLLPGSGNNRL